ncbi:hypothetical protein BDY17DRAFT_315053 [Neohortaea acidophila]|uniref:F-box domain-containing protein n=1 Tax=Neohortaea acidophila TaxID=245834 RepID=A0A6A6Q2A8_9PEZI|nr:uncharacterized protein BDY17DRAFT_315053 [Neohortaea acidophila]KAF2486086.1 hypothetical protein BDY17DRAFT_315053 [Neohortaea acidophila]
MANSSAPRRAPSYTSTVSGDIPRFVTFTSPVRPSQAASLPLNIIARIAGFLDDPADIARLTRTSRLLYYMCLPQLYEKVNLHSYPEVRYTNGKPEGFGSGSPFIMGLNGLVTRSHAGLVQDFRVWGQWNEAGVEDFAKGRVPDNSMMLNILLRAAIDRMTKLQTFSWELDCKPLKTMYQGLGAHATLTSLTIKFPKSRSPRPTVIIPPMANLRVFKALDIDPLCYPDDISVMLLHSRKLEDLRLHFVPRIRQQAESLLNLTTYFGRCATAGHKLPLKHFALQNFYGPNDQMVDFMLNEKTCKSVSMLDAFGGMSGGPMNKFYDDTWKQIPQDVKAFWPISRCNEPAEQHVRMLTNATSHEQFYVVSSRVAKAASSPTSTPSAPHTPAKTPTLPSPDVVELGKQYLNVLGSHHGKTLRNLLLSDQWILGGDEIKTLVQQCQHLEQLGLAVEGAELRPSLSLILASLPKLRALRILNGEVVEQAAGQLGITQRDIGHLVEKVGAKQFRYLGLGDRVFEISLVDDVQHVEIWGLDYLDISVDPVAPFSP